MNSKTIRESLTATSSRFRTVTALKKELKALNKLADIIEVAMSDEAIASLRKETKEEEERVNTLANTLLSMESTNKG